MVRHPFEVRSYIDDVVVVAVGIVVVIVNFDAGEAGLKVVVKRNSLGRLRVLEINCKEDRRDRRVSRFVHYNEQEREQHN